MQPQNQNDSEQMSEPAPTPVAAAPVAEVPPVDTDAELDDQVVPDDEELEDDEPEEQSVAPHVPLTNPVSWQAKEYIHQEKNTMWFVLFAIVLAGLMAAAVLLMKSWSFAILLVVIAAVIIVFAKRPPRVMTYSLSEKGLHIGDTLHAFSDFKAFGVIRDGEEYSVMLIPTKRFLPGQTVYFPEASGEEIVDILGDRLPMQDLNLDWLDRFVRKLRL